MEPSSDPAAVLTAAEKKFNSLDVNLNGTLEANELLELAAWVFASFHPDGQPMSEQQKQVEADKLMLRLDKNDDGVMDFEEFTGWFERTTGSIAKFEQSRQQKQAAAEPAPEPPAVSQQPVSRDLESRRAKLGAVFAMFDLDRSGRVELKELLELGKARRALGQKAGEWTQQLNEKLMQLMDVNKDGSIDVQEFTSHMEPLLPPEPELFENAMVQFSGVARSCSLLRLPIQQPKTSPRALFVTTPGRSPRAMMPAGSRANTVLNAARGIFDAANKTQNDVLELAEIRFLAKQVGPGLWSG